MDSVKPLKVWTILFLYRPGQRIFTSIVQAMFMLAELVAMLDNHVQMSPGIDYGPTGFA